MLFASNKKIKTSLYKARLITNLIKGLSASSAMLQLQFSSKSVSEQILKILNTAVAIGQNNYKIDIDNLYISQVILGRSTPLKRSRPRAKGRIDKIVKPFVNVSILLKEVK